jgi:DmsE family decaheme c-type cytochrome
MRHERYVWWLAGTLALLVAPRMADAQLEARYAGAAVCAECHQDKADGLGKTLHGKTADHRTPMSKQGCETCHGPGAAHAEDPENSKPRQFDKLSPDAVGAVCTTCHASGEHALWAGSKHDARGVTCTNCHSVHNPAGAKQLKAETQPQLCAGCHQAVVNKLNRFNHMPVREEKLSCSSCHNPHGSANVKLLRAGITSDQACTSCHSEKRGPMLWEHAPVTNSCATCHDPHGSSNERMLVAKVPFLCQRCHVTSRHPPTVYSQYSIENSTASTRIAGRGCVICHAQIHGSNSPNGKAFLR